VLEPALAEIDGAGASGDVVSARRRLEDIA